MTNPEQPIATSPTINFNVESLSHHVNNQRFSIKIWDMAGGCGRAFWRHYYVESNAIVWVLDSNDRGRIDESKEILSKMMSESDLENSILLVYANKQDLGSGVLTLPEIKERLSLKNIQQKWAVFGCSAKTGDGLRDGLDWICSNAYIN